MSFASLREVRVVLEGVDKYNNLFGTVKFVVNEQPVDLGEQIVGQGLAKVIRSRLAAMMRMGFRVILRMSHPLVLHIPCLAHCE